MTATPAAPVPLRAEFSGSTIDFTLAEFSSCMDDLNDAADWSVPPKFRGDSPPPTTIVKLPAAHDGQS